jgi:hypothetical protein
MGAASGACRSAIVNAYSAMTRSLCNVGHAQ